MLPRENGNEESALLVLLLLPAVQVGGYLAFIGLFCLEAALGLSSGKDIQGVDTWGVLFNTRYTSKLLH